MTPTAPLTPEELDALQKLAEEATPGPWQSKRASKPVDGAYDYAIGDAAGEVIAEAFGRTSETNWPPSEANAVYIAAANPATLLRLLAIAREALKLSDYCERGEAVYGHDFQGECYDAALTIEMQRNDIHDAREEAKRLAAQVREAEAQLAQRAAERDGYERVELKHCQGEETLEELIHRLEFFGENAFNAGYTNGIGVAIQAITHEKEQRQASTVWDGMSRAINAVEAVRDGTFVWVEDEPLPPPTAREGICPTCHGSL